MAYFFGDGFDLYSNGAITDCAGYWDGSFGNGSTFALATSGRFAQSRSIQGQGFGTPAPYITKTSSINDAVHHISTAYKQDSISGTSACPIWITLYDGTTAQCSICFNANGSIQFTSGAYNGTVLANYNGAVTSPNVWYQFEFEIVINNTTGSIAVRKNGNVTNDFSLGSLNTRNSTNNYANKIGLGSANTGFALAWIDDFLWRSDASAVPWSGDVRCYTRMPASDVQAQFTKTATTYSQQVCGSTGISNSLTTANYMQFVANRSGNVTSAAVAIQSSSTAHVKMALFSNVGANTIGTVLATSSEVTNPGAGTMTVTFPTPVRLVAGQTYWMGINEDAGVAYNVINSGSAAVTVITLTQTYATWPVNSPGGTPAVINIPGNLTLVYTPALNCDAVGEFQEDGSTSYVYSSTVGQNDLYNIGSITTTPVNILGVVTRGYFQKSDAGTRNCTVQVKSGSTTVQGTSTALPAGSWQWISRTDLTDPATSAAWTATGVNNLQIGPVVVA